MSQAETTEPRGWDELGELERWKLMDDMEAGRPVDDRYVPAALEHQRSMQRQARRGMILAPPIAAALVVPAAAFGTRMADPDVTLADALAIAAVPSAFFVFMGFVFPAMMYHSARNIERDLLEQIGQHQTDEPRLITWATRVARAKIAVFFAFICLWVIGLALTPLWVLLGIEQEPDPTNWAAWEIGYAIAATLLGIVLAVGFYRVISRSRT